MTFQQKGPWSKKTYVSWISNAILCDIWKKLPIPAHYFSFFHLEWHQWPPRKILRCVALAFNPYRFVRFHGQYNLASTIWRSSRIWLKNMSLLACGWFHAEYFQLWFKNRASIFQVFLAGAPFSRARIGGQVRLYIHGSHVDPGGQPGLKKKERKL